MRSLNFLPLLFSTVPFCLADVEFISPAQGASIPAGTIDIVWKDNGIAPSLSDLSTYQVDLIAGGDTDDSSTIIANLVPANTPFTSESHTRVSVGASSGGDVANAYYLRISALSKEGRQTVNFSPRFSVIGMTGNFPDSIASHLQKPISNLVGRAAVAPAAPAAPAPPPAASFLVSYLEQDGPTRYAPMMKQPGSSITQQNTSPLYPTSSVVYAKTFLPPVAGIATTLTASQTFVATQIENTAAPQSKPTDDMQKFLNRWKD